MGTGITMSQYVSHLSSKPEALTMHQQIADSQEKACVEARSHGKHVDWDAMEDRIMMVHQTDQTVEEAPGFTHYQWDVYMVKFPGGLEVHASEGHFRHRTKRGVDGVCVPKRAGITEIKFQHSSGVTRS